MKSTTYPHTASQAAWSMFIWMSWPAWAGIFTSTKRHELWYLTAFVGWIILSTLLALAIRYQCRLTKTIEVAAAFWKANPDLD